MSQKQSQSVKLALWDFLKSILYTKIKAKEVNSLFAYVPKNHVGIVEKMGKYNRTVNAGIHFVIPFIERIANIVPLTPQTINTFPSPIILSDNTTQRVMFQIDYEVVNPKNFTYEVADAKYALEMFVITAARNIFGEVDRFFFDEHQEALTRDINFFCKSQNEVFGVKIIKISYETN